MPTDKGLTTPTVQETPNGAAQTTKLAEEVDDRLVQELTTAQRDLLPASARWPGRTLWERLTPAARRLMTWDEVVQQWREELAARLHAAQHAIGGTDPVTPAAIGAAPGNHGGHLTVGAWTPIGLQNGWSTSGGYGPPRARIVGTNVELSGFVYGAGSTSSRMSVLSSAFRPAYTRYLPAAWPSTRFVYITTAGELARIGPVDGASVSLDGLFYSLV